MRPQIPRAFGSGLLLFGAFAIGGVLHEVFVEGSIGLFSPVAVLGTLVGVALILGGRRMERAFEPSDYVPGAESDADEEAEDEYDESHSPVPESALEGRDADESYDGS